MEEPKAIGDGGPAFPNPLFTAANGEVTYPSAGWGMGGMTLRDYFAAKALNGLIASMKQGQPIEIVAAAAYEMADAMLKARTT